MDLATVLHMFRRRWLAIVACLVGGVVAAGVATSTATPQYESRARLFMNLPFASGVQEALQGVQLSSQLLQSYAEVASSEAALQRVAKELDLEDTGSLRGRISAAAVPNTLLIDVRATDPDPQRARRLADAGAAALIETMADLEAGKQNPITAKVIEGAGVPGAASSPDPAKNLVVGVGVGALLGLAIALGLESLDRSITSSGHARVAFGSPTLVQVPHLRRVKTSPLVLFDEEAQVDGAESFRSLRTALRAGSQPSALVVTSTADDDGKSTVAANLAIAAAEAGERVIVVDADLRRPRLGQMFGADSAGLTGVLKGRASLDEALRPAGNNLEILPAGSQVTNPSELLGSVAMSALMGELRRRADLVVFDVSPLLPYSDAVLLSSMCDGVVMVARWGRTRYDAASEARAMLNRVGANLTGVVLNDVR